MAAPRAASARTMKALLLIALGGACGAVLRHLGQNLAALATWPWGTFAVNAVGCFAAGALLSAGAGAAWFEAGGRLFLVVGALGAFTTFSAFSVETLALWREARLVAAAGYVLASVAVSLLAACAGQRLGGALR